MEVLSIGVQGPAGSVTTVADAAARLALTGLSIGTEVYQADNGFFYKLQLVGGEATAANWKPTPKAYRALLTQASTSDPVATVLENTLGGTPVPARAFAGAHQLELEGAFPAAKTFIMGTSQQLNKYPVLFRSSDDVIFLDIYDSLSSGNQEDTFSQVRVEILVYP